MEALRTAPTLSATTAMARAEEILAQAVTQPVANLWRTRPPSTR
jgi:hypothetical protein